MLQRNLTHLTKGFVLFVLLFSCLGINAFSGELDAKLKALLATAPGDTVIDKVQVRMADQAPIQKLVQELDAAEATRAQRHVAVIEALRQTADATQWTILTALSEYVQAGKIVSFEPLWILNAILVKGQLRTLGEIALRNDVESVFIEPEPLLIEPVSRANDDFGAGGIEPGLRQIKANLLWKRGIRGQGRLVCTFDTGVDANHPSLFARWRGNEPGVDPGEAWLDDAGKEFPWDEDSHGTHVTGIMIGAVEGDTTGVAPAAKWIAAKILGSGSISTSKAFQWAADPDNNPLTMDDVPDVINNSWGFGPGCLHSYWDSMDNTEAAGVVVLWAASNDGPSPATIGSPASRQTTPVNAFAVGAVDVANVIADFSSRGPSPCDHITIKPEVSAPGVDVRSSVLNNGFAYYSGTSMSTPHVAGGVALLRQVNPDIDPQSLKYALLYSAYDLGAAGEDNDYGWGILDLDVASKCVENGVGRLDGTVTDFDSGEPIQDAAVEIPEIYKKVKTNESGKYSMKICAGTHEVITNSFGYFADTSSVILANGGFVKHDVKLKVITSGTISGKVLQDSTLTPLGSQIFFYLEGDTLMGTTTSDSLTGEYTMTVMGGNYEVKIIPPVPFTIKTETNVRVIPGGSSSHDILIGKALILLIDDDGGDNFETYIEPDLESIALPFRTWEVKKGSAAAPAIDLMGKGVIIWISGNAATGIILEQDEASLVSFLDNGGRLFLSGQNIVEELSKNKSAFLTNYLKLEYGGKSSQNLLTTVPDDLLGKYLKGIITKGPNPPNNQNSQDILVPLENAATSLKYNNGVGDAMCWVQNDEKNYRLVVSGFGAEGVQQFTGYSTRLDLLKAVIGFLMPGTGIENPGSGTSGTLPLRAKLSQNFPNPFNPVTTISYSIPQGNAKLDVSLKVYDLVGRLVAVLVDGEKSPGTYTAVWHGTNSSATPVASGIYIYKLVAGNYSESRRMILLK